MTVALRLSAAPLSHTRDLSASDCGRRSFALASVVAALVESTYRAAALLSEHCHLFSGAERLAELSKMQLQALVFYDFDKVATEFDDETGIMKVEFMMIVTMMMVFSTPVV